MPHHAMLLSSLLLLIATAATITAQQWPQKPFIDKCSGLELAVCRTKQPVCKWFEDAIPWCYDSVYRAVQPLEVYQHDFVKLFFEYNNGVHLSEGTAQKIFYNVNHESCAKKCITSTLEDGKIRCLSFDFHELPNVLTGEEAGNGVCILNSGNQDTARLRNVDQGMSDNELFSPPFLSGHYRLRTTNLGGHYAVRNPRGGQLATQLDYPGDARDYNQIITWGKSRWGISHLEGGENKNPPKLECEKGKINNTGAVDDFAPSIDIYAGYTPVNENQKCPGLVTKNEARELCKSSGGYLCANQGTVLKLEGRKLGCSYDENDVWSEADAATPTAKKFVRCCANYRNMNNCEEHYNEENFDFCSLYLSFVDCVDYASGKARQFRDGFGKLLERIRNNHCGGGVCNKDVLIQNWRARDRCVWCLEPGTGNGQCRTGNDFGICPEATGASKSRFDIQATKVCGPKIVCKLIDWYPDLCARLLQPGDCPNVNPGTVGDKNKNRKCNFYQTRASCRMKRRCQWVGRGSTDGQCIDK